MGRQRQVGGRAAWTRALTAAATALAAIVTLTSSLSPNAPGRQRLLEALEPDVAQAVAHALGVVGGLALLWLAVGVLHGRRSAGRAAIVVLGVLAVVHTAKGLDYEEAAIGLAVAFALHLVLRSGSRAERTPATVLAALTGLIALAGAYALTLTVTVVSGRPAGLGAAVLAAGADVAWAVPDAASSGVAHVAAHVLVAVAVGSLVALLRALLAPARANDGHDEDDHRRAARLVAAHGHDSIAPFALRADKAFHFAGGAALAYRAVRETAVVAGDPIGPAASRAPVMASFLEQARAKGWDVVLVGARRESLDDYAALGLKAMQIGVEAVVDPQAFTLAGRASKTVRKAVARVERHGWTVEVRSGAELDAGLAGELAAVEAAWRRTRRRLYGFAMAGDRLWGAPEDAGDVYVLARNPAGELRAFQRYVRYRGGLSLDAMRRLDDEPNGISDTLVAAALAHARELGLSEVSLNFAGFGHIMAAQTLERRSHRVARWALQRTHGRFQLERLARFADKFGPEWRPRYLVFTARTRLPLAALRVLQAEAYLKPPPVRPSGDAWAPAPVPIGTAAVAAPGR